MTRTRRLLLAVVLLLPAALYAVDGQVLINQSTVNAAGGFPYVITQPGSYKLSGNLVTNDSNKTMIIIAADHVTLDLGGFMILGPTDCSGGFNPCANKGFGFGIRTDTFRFNITIRNGTIQGMGSDGISLLGDSHLVESLHLRSNGGNGIEISSSLDLGASIVQNCAVQRNAQFGILLGVGSVYHNVVNENNASGITLATGSASDNVVYRNVGHGMFLQSRVLYKGNLLDGNVDGAVTGGVNMGQNLCDGSPCPGAVF